MKLYKIMALCVVASGAAALQALPVTELPAIQQPAAQQPGLLQRGMQNLQRMTLKPNAPQQSLKELHAELVKDYDLLFGSGRKLSTFGEAIIPERAQAAFHQHLKDATAFIGNDDAQRAKDFASVKQGWMHAIANLNLLFMYLRDNRRKESRLTAQDAAIDWRDLDYSKVSLAKVRAFFPTLTQDIDSAEKIMKSAYSRASSCYGQACKDRFKLLELHAQALLSALNLTRIAVENLEKAKNRYLSSEEGQELVRKQGKKIIGL